MAKTKTKCPLCNAKLESRQGDVSFPVDKRKVKVTNIQYLECIKCGEKIFDNEAQKKIEATVYGPDSQQIA